MYMVSRPKPLPVSLGEANAKDNAAFLPQGYLLFLHHYGEGTYRGWMNVQRPDAEVLKPFAEYGLWEHDEDSPITERQIGECTAIGTTVDGDFLAVHAKTGQLLWLPRHGDRVTAIALQTREPEGAETYAAVLDEIYSQVYGTPQAGAVYYEPWTGSRNHQFLRLPPDRSELTLPELAGKCREAFLPDLSIETEYSCHLFYRELGGYVRFNLAYGQEVAVMYEQDEQQTFSVIEQWLLAMGCEAL